MLAFLPILLSDERWKTDIEPVGTQKWLHDLQIRYKWDKTYSGLRLKRYNVCSPASWSCIKSSST